MSQTCVGFSFGNLNTCVGFVETKTFEQFKANSALIPAAAVVPNLQGERTTPNFITFGQKEIFVGIPSLSKFQLKEIEFANQTIFAFQQLLSQQVELCEKNEKEEEVRNNLKNYNFPFKWNVVEKDSKKKKAKQDADKQIEIEINWNGELKNLPIIPIISNYFNKIKDIVSAFVDVGETGTKKADAPSDAQSGPTSAANPEQAQSIKKIVLAHPVHFFNQPEKQEKLISDLESIFEKIKVEVVENLPEPIAACIAYGLDKPVCDSEMLTKAGVDLKSIKRIAVLDIGHSRSTATILSREPTKGFLRMEKVKSMEGIAGSAIDDALLEYCYREIQSRHGSDTLNQCLKTNERAIMRLRSAFKEFKTTICAPNAQKAHLACESLFNGIDFAMDVSRPRFEMAIQGILSKNINLLLDPLLKEGEVFSSPIDVIVLAGGSSNIPKLSQLLDSYLTNAFGKKIPILSSIPCEEVIACGAGIYGFYSKKYRHFFQKRNNLDIEKPVETGKFLKNTISCRLNGGFVREIFKRGEMLPIEKKMVFSSLADSKISMLELLSSNADGKSMTAVSYIPLQTSKRFEQTEVTFKIDESSTLRAEKSATSEELRVFVPKENITKQLDSISQLPPNSALMTLQKFETYICNAANKLADKPEKLEKAKPVLDEAVEWLSTATISTEEDISNKHMAIHEKLTAAIKSVGAAAK